MSFKSEDDASSRGFRSTKCILSKLSLQLVPLLRKTIKGPRTLLTIVTTLSRISPLKGRKTTHWYFTGNVTNPVPSRMRPCPMVSTAVTATTNPWRPLKAQRTDTSHSFVFLYKSQQQESPRHSGLSPLKQHQKFLLEED